MLTIKTMKILFSDNSLFGLVNFREPVFRHFYELGYDIVLVAPKPVDGEDMVKAAPAYAKYIAIEMQRTGQNPAGDMKYFLQLFKIYKKEKPDYIFHYTIKPNIYGSIAAKLVGIRSSCMVAGLGYAFDSNGIKNQIARSLYKIGLKCSEKVMLLNSSNKQKLISLGILKESKVVFLKGGEGLVLDSYKCCSEASSDVVFLMVARILYDKGYSEFVEASRRICIEYPKVRCCLLGPVDEMYPNAVYRKQIDSDVEAGYVEYLGFTDNPSEIMSREEIVVVLPSYHEGFSRSLMETCALGRPIITTDIPGCKELVIDGFNGFLCKRKDSESLYEAMKKYILLSLDARSKMGMNGRALAEEHFDVKDVIKIYESIIAG